MDKKVIFREGDYSFVLVDKKIKKLDITTRVDLLTVREEGNILGKNMMLGSILNHCPYMEESELENEELEKLLENVVDIRDYKR